MRVLLEKRVWVGVGQTIVFDPKYARMFSEIEEALIAVQLAQISGDYPEAIMEVVHEE